MKRPIRFTNGNADRSVKIEQVNDRYVVTKYMSDGSESMRPSSATSVTGAMRAAKKFLGGEPVPASRTAKPAVPGVSKVELSKVEPRKVER
jgi:hypothetical protein